jgi:preprotein translocase subunit YajC
MSSVLALLAADNSGGSSLISFLFLPLMLAAAYFLLIRPQRRRQRDAASLQTSLQVGDEVITTSGLYGFITGFEGEIVWLEIDDNVQIRVLRGAVSRKVDTSGQAPVAKSDKVDDVEEDTSDK